MGNYWIENGKYYDLSRFRHCEMPRTCLARLVKLKSFCILAENYDGIIDDKWVIGILQQLMRDAQTDFRQKYPDLPSSKSKLYRHLRQNYRDIKQWAERENKFEILFPDSPKGGE